MFHIDSLSGFFLKILKNNSRPARCLKYSKDISFWSNDYTPDFRRIASFFFVEPKKYTQDVFVNLK